MVDDGKELAAKWVNYRPGIRVVDCTIRDGGLMNDHNYTDKTVRAVWEACSAGGIDYMEIGYKGARRQFDPKVYGPWKCVSEDDIKRIVGDTKQPNGTKISVMADVDRTDYHTDIVPKKDSLIDLVRVACYVKQIPGALDMVKDAHDKGYETALNLMSVSVVSEKELETALEMFAASEADTLYVVDSFGSLFNEQVRWLVQKFQQFALPAKKKLGIHPHNNQQLAFANTIEAITLGVDMLDASLAGLGRGAGNCNTELLIGFLRNPKYHMRPLIKCIQEDIEPLRKDMQWGPDIPYMLLGQLNQHPKAAMDFNEGPDRGNLLKFYDTVVTNF